MTDEPAAGKPTAEHDGQLYHFCSQGCRDRGMDERLADFHPVNLELRDALALIAFHDHQIDRLGLQWSPRVDPREQEKVFHQYGHPPRLGLHPAERVCHIGWDGLASAPGQLGVLHRILDEQDLHLLELVHSLTSMAGNWKPKQTESDEPIAHQGDARESLQHPRRSAQSTTSPVAEP